MNTKQVKIIVGENEHEYLVDVEVLENENVKDIILKATNKVINNINGISEIYNLAGEAIIQASKGNHIPIETTTRYIK